MVTFISFVALLLVLIFVHELGHFLAAKSMGVKVERFSLGFPPKVWSKTIGETEYQLTWLPLGGYVKMYGEDSASEEIVPPEMEHRSFSHQKPFTKIIITLTGPLFNLIFAGLLFWILIWAIGIQHLSPVLGPIRPGSPAEAAGLKMDDRLLTVDSRPARYFDVLDTALKEGGGRPLTITVNRDDSPNLTVVLNPIKVETKDIFGDLKIIYEVGISNRMRPIVDRVIPNKPAEAAGLKAGDYIVAVDKKPILDWADVLDAIQGPLEERGSTTPKVVKSQTFEINRNGQNLTLNLTPELVTGVNQNGNVTFTPMVGMESKVETLTEPIGFLQAAAYGFIEAGYMIKLTLLSVHKLVTGQISAKTLGGPILIAKITGAKAKEGLVPLLNLAAFISINLGVLNLLPIPILDGGQIVFFLIEALRHKPLGLRFRETAQWVGMIFLGLLMVLVFYNDINRLITQFSAPAAVENPILP
ncbi:MAG: RIP metalloprotease RseP [Candidatus Adiutrix intracellularis]|jgi:regulator of sigma E protease|nr:RIP metalloprotease RseP [Candidatus Adiutrix intracellularis]